MAHWTRIPESSYSEKCWAKKSAGVMGMIVAVVGLVHQFDPRRALGWVAVTVVADGLEGSAGYVERQPRSVGSAGAHCGNAADLQRVDCVCDDRTLPGGGCLGDVRQRRDAALDRLDGRRWRRPVRCLGAGDVRRSGRLHGLLQRRRLGAGMERLPVFVLPHLFRVAHDGRIGMIPDSSSYGRPDIARVRSSSAAPLPE